MVIDFMCFLRVQVISLRPWMMRMRTRAMAKSTGCGGIHPLYREEICFCSPEQHSRRKDSARLFTSAQPKRPGGSGVYGCKEKTARESDQVARCVSAPGSEQHACAPRVP